MSKRNLVIATRFFMNNKKNQRKLWKLLVSISILAASKFSKSHLGLFFHSPLYLGFLWGSGPLSNILPSHCHGFSNRETWNNWRSCEINNGHLSLSEKNWRPWSCWFHEKSISLRETPVGTDPSSRGPESSSQVSDIPSFVKDTSQALICNTLEMLCMTRDLVWHIRLSQGRTSSQCLIVSTLSVLG